MTQRLLRLKLEKESTPRPNYISHNREEDCGDAYDNHRVARSKRRFNKQPGDNADDQPKQGVSGDDSIGAGVKV